MALVNLNDVLRQADRQKYAVGAFNQTCLETVEAVLAAAVAQHSPVILNVAQVHFKYIDLETLVPVMRRAAERVPVPVVIHLDHGMDFETVMRAIRMGFTSVMIDASTLPFEENVALVRDVVRCAHAVGVTVEAELGHVGGEEGASGYSEEAKREWFTRPEQAQEFCERTKVDALAVAIGSAHGLYKSEPRLELDLLAEIDRAVGAFLVLHGGSGIPDDQFRQAIALGINKINFYTEMSLAGAERVKQVIARDPKIISYPDLALAARAAMQETVEERMRVFGCAGACLHSNALCASCQAVGCAVRNGNGHAPAVAKDQNQDLVRLITEITVSALRELR